MYPQEKEGRPVERFACEAGEVGEAGPRLADGFSTGALLYRSTLWKRLLSAGIVGSVFVRE